MLESAIIDAALAPFAEQVGMQGFAYGLLGLKTVRKLTSFVREQASGSKPEKSDG